MATPRGDGTGSPDTQGLDAARTSLRAVPAVRQRALVTLTPRPGAVAPTPPVDDPGPARGPGSLDVLGGAARSLRARSRRPHVRRSLIGVAALAQAFILVSAIAWWAGQGSMEASTAVAPVAWTGVVHDVGAAGVNLRSSPQAVPGTSRDTAARGSRLALTCGRTGDLVTDESGARSDMWLRTTDGLYVSLLYVDVADRTSIVSCSDASEDAPVLALDDPDGRTGSPSGEPTSQPAVVPAGAGRAEPADSDTGPVARQESAPGSGTSSDGGAEQDQRPGQPDAANQDPAAGSQDAGAGTPGQPGVDDAQEGALPRSDGGVGPVPVAGDVRVRVEHQDRAPLTTTTTTRSRSANPPTTTTTTRNRDTVAVG
jgi:hypothetical protein